MHCKTRAVKTGKPARDVVKDANVVNAAASAVVVANGANGVSAASAKKLATIKPMASMPPRP